MSRTRTCLGCEGTGDQKPNVRPIPDLDCGAYHWRCGTCLAANTDLDGECQFCQCQGLYCTRWSCSDQRHFVACSACQGSGVIVDRIPASDALADAETLRLHPIGEGRLRKDPATGHKYRAMNRYLVIRDADYLATRLRAAGPDCIENLAYVTERVTRAAFRAVPGLRG